MGEPRKVLDVRRRAKEEPCACRSCGLVSWVWFGSANREERQAECPGCGRSQCYRRPLFEDEVLYLPCVMEDRDEFPLTLWRDAMEHNERCRLRAMGKATGETGRQGQA